MTGAQLRLDHPAVPVHDVAAACLLEVASPPGGAAEQLVEKWIGAGCTRHAPP